ncbi:MAG: hypothetical protein CM15mP18_0470 [Methanobacteriota archaeon]|nr:MAG: hypothetical protein CM15mP18_0470 [Euryarchaeota archaeon]
MEGEAQQMIGVSNKTRPIMMVHGLMSARLIPVLRIPTLCGR